MAGYIAAIPLVVAKDESGRDVYIYEGRQIPENVTKDSIARLLKEKFIAKIDEPSDATSGK